MKNTRKAVKSGVIAMLFTMAAFGHTLANPIEITKHYAFSQIRLGFLDHFHDGEKSKDFMLSVPLFAFSREVQLDPFVILRDRHGLKQFGFSMPIFVSQRFVLTPAMFQDFDAGQFGVAISAVIRVR